MGEAVSEYIYRIMSTIFFCSALAILIVFLNCLIEYNKGQIESQKTKSSVTMDVSMGYDDELIYVQGSEVFTDIICMDEDISVYLDGTKLDEDFLDDIREKSSTDINDLKSKISLDSDYLVKYTYDSDNEIKVVEFIRR